MVEGSHAMPWLVSYTAVTTITFDRLLFNVKRVYEIDEKRTTQCNSKVYSFNCKLV